VKLVELTPLPARTWPDEISPTAPEMAPEAVRCNWQPEVRTTAASDKAVPRLRTSREYNMTGESVLLVQYQV
jgi:hypothetical protein